MKQPILILLFLFTVCSTFSLNAKQNDLQACWDAQVKSLQQENLTFSFKEKRNELEHSFEPWQQTNFIGKGKIWVNATDFVKQDTLTSGKRIYFSKTVFNKNEMLFLDYGDKDLFAVTKEMFMDQNFESARYVPVNLIHYFVSQKIKAGKSSTDNVSVYETWINNTSVKLTIDRKTHLLQKVTLLSNDDLFGDVQTTFSYKDYTNIGKCHIAQTINIEKINGKIIEEVQLLQPSLVATMPMLLTKPQDYKFAEKSEKKPEITTEKYNDHIFFIELKHTDDKVMMVTFSDFILIAEAPLKSENGALIIEEAKRLAPGKPIRYFAFGHYHPHYIGGIRPFVHAGAKVICTPEDEAFVKYLVAAPHSIHPDDLQNEPQMLQTEILKDSLTIADGAEELKIYHIGAKSEHTKDYLIYYFPKEQLLFEDDLVAIKKEGEITKARSQQAGLYNAIKSLGLDVNTIVQSWPVSNYGIKTVIPFEDLEQSMNAK
jgi:hypothetical protein